MKRTKDEIISFKVDQSLLRELNQIPNRSQFIRNALRAALGAVCPLCQGAGTLTPDQQRHWEVFNATHGLDECQDCHALHLVCQRQGDQGS